MYFVRIPKLFTFFFPKMVWNVAPNQIALTFDDGTHPESTVLLLQLLEEAQCVSTHFLLGKNCIDFPKEFKLLKSSNHSIGHHTYSHFDAWKCDTELYYEDFEKAKNIVNTNLFRPPYGKFTPPIINRIQKDFPAIKICQFNLMPGDFGEKVDTETLKKRIYQARGGDIIVLHDQPECFEKYAPFLKEWIGDMRRKGLEFVLL